LEHIFKKAMVRITYFMSGYVVLRFIRTYFSRNEAPKTFRWNQMAKLSLTTGLTCYRLVKGKGSHLNCKRRRTADGDTAPCILQLGIRWERVVSFTPIEYMATVWMRWWREYFCPGLESNPDRSAHRLVTKAYWLRYLGSRYCLRGPNNDSVRDPKANKLLRNHPRCPLWNIIT
jgi:hypothetical protein